MILYHYTAIGFLNQIMREGLARGEVPITYHDIEKAVWFTNDPASTGHGLCDDAPLTGNVLAAVERQIGKEAASKVRTPDKRRVRIEVVIPSSDRALKAWLPWARKRLQRDWLDELTRLGGGKAKAETWFIYHGVVSPSTFKAIWVRGGDDAFHPISDADRHEASFHARDR